jgi:thiamine biosynthesis lipoprotein
VTEAMVDELDRVASRFRPDSEISRLTAAAAVAGVDVVVSELLGGCIEAALHAADITDGLVGPTVGQAVAAAGYDVDLDAVRARGPVTTPGLVVEVPVPGWRAIGYDVANRHLLLPRGTMVDLGATAKACAADLIAARLARAARGFPRQPRR